MDCASPSRRSLTLEGVEAVTKKIDVEMVEQSGEPFLLPFRFTGRGPEKRASSEKAVPTESKSQVGRMAARSFSIRSQVGFRVVFGL
jgi:hypothetical protein